MRWNGWGRSVRGALVVVVVAASCTVGVRQASAAETIVVNSTSDNQDLNAADGRCFAFTDGAGVDHCTLRAAIQHANGNANPTETDLIRFKIPGRGPHTIVVGSVFLDFPLITQRVTIDGYSEPGSEPNTKTSANNADIRVRVVQGTQSVSAFRVTTNGTLIRGLEISNFTVAYNVNGGSDNRFEGNHVFGGANMLRLFGGATDNVIGGKAPKKHNLISSGGFPLSITDAGTERNLVLGNLIGTARNGKDDDGNDRGVFISAGAANNQIGGDSASSSNTIAFNGEVASDDGIGMIDAGVGNRILRNSIHSNLHLGIDLGTSGVTPNDALDADSGPNRLQNFPGITSVKRKQDRLIVAGSLHSVPNTTFTLRFFGNDVADGSGFGEGQRFRFAKRVTTDGAGNAPFRFQSDKVVRKGSFLTATATNESTGDTSEFSEAVQAS